MAGYRNSNVFIRNALHVPLAPEAVRDCMRALFELLQAAEPIEQIIQRPEAGSWTAAPSALS